MLARIDEDGAHAGSLEVIFGPMFSGKSTELQRRLRRHTVASRRVLVVKIVKHMTKSLMTKMRYSFLKDVCVRLTWAGQGRAAGRCFAAVRCRFGKPRDKGVVWARSVTAYARPSPPNPAWLVS